MLEDTPLALFIFLSPPLSPSPHPACISLLNLVVLLIKTHISLAICLTVNPLFPPLLPVSFAHFLNLPIFVCACVCVRVSVYTCFVPHLSDEAETGGVPVVTVTAACDRVTDQPDLQDAVCFHKGEV